MNKNITIIIVLLIVAAVGLYVWKNQGMMQSSNNTQTSTTTSSGNSSVAGPGEHCGGNMSTAKSCGDGYQCQPDPQSHLPFGDVGGICVKASVQGEFGQ